MYHIARVVVDLWISILQKSGIKLFALGSEQLTRRAYLGLHLEASIRIFCLFFFFFSLRMPSIGGFFFDLFGGEFLAVVHDALSQETNRTSITPACLASSCP